MLPELPFLFIAGFLGGMLNSIAGGGTFITFPALLLVGVSPVSANATNTFASCSGYISGAFAFRKELLAHKKELPAYIIISLLGGISGAWLLLQTSELLFRQVIPWLLLIATILFIFSAQINNTLRNIASHHHYASLAGGTLLIMLLFFVCVYGGFFNAGLGIIILSYLALAGYSHINTMNGLKLLMSSCVSLIAIVLFIYENAIAWYEGTIVLLGTLTGGYISAHLSRQINPKHIRSFVIFVSTLITTYFFYEVYFM